MISYRSSYFSMNACKNIYKGVPQRTFLNRGVMQREVIRLPWFELIQRTLMKEGNVSEAVAKEVSWRVLQFFGNSDEIIDNLLDAEDRRLFYFLQDLHVVKTHWEETQLLSGLNWRIFYWNLDLRGMEKVIWSDPVLLQSDIYVGLPDDAWHCHCSPS